jgi:uncharacterized protein YjcR
MLVEIVKDYYTVVESIPKLIDASGFRNDFLAEKLGIKAQTFSSKKTNQRWSKDELLKLFNFLDTDDVEDTYMVELMKSRENDETISVEEFKRNIGKLL